MNKILSTKINLLVHLAKVDGRFDRSERELLLTILKEKGLDESYLEIHPYESVDLDALLEWPGKTELFFWILKMIKADNYLHPNELAYARELAPKLSFKPDAVNFYCEHEIPDLSAFEVDVQRFKLKA